MAQRNNFSNTLRLWHCVGMANGFNIDCLANTDCKVSPFFVIYIQFSAATTIDGIHGIVHVVKRLLENLRNINSNKTNNSADLLSPQCVLFLPVCEIASKNVIPDGFVFLPLSQYIATKSQSDDSMNINYF